jgi:multimeric flavodoxin WrbA
VNILILNGNPDPARRDFDRYIEELIHILRIKHTIVPLTLRDLEVKHCTGCRGCWVKTPGECVFHDAGNDICRHYIHSDFILFASPVRAGFTSSLLKRACDRLIPLLHPHFEIVSGEAGHKARYDTYPKIGLLLEKSKATDKEDLRIITDIYRRLAIHFKTTLSFVKLTSDPAKEVAHAINAI